MNLDIKIYKSHKMNRGISLNFVLQWLLGYRKLLFSLKTYLDLDIIFSKYSQTYKNITMDCKPIFTNTKNCVSKLAYVWQK